MVSIIIPAYNAEKTIKQCLESIMNQDYADDYEVIVVDDGSTDSTPRIVSEFSKVRLIRQKNAGPAFARNKGALGAKGEIILFTDSDCIPGPSWISEMLKPFSENNEVVGVKGSYKTRQKEIIARFVQLEYEDKYNYMLKSDYIDFIDTYSAGFKKTVFIEMNGYNTEFPVACAEDIELSYRISSRGYKMVFNPNTIVYHTHPSRLPDYLKKKYKFAYWRMLAVKKNPKKLIKDSHTPQLMKLQLLFPPVIFINILLSLISGKFVFILFLMLLLFVLTVIPFAFQAIKKDLTVGLLSPFFLFLRASSQFLGISGGILYLFRKKNKCHTLPSFKD
jgi:cellulose synthase/poly-beta-1,6-N-acetylglucosamine synthase-like glycosyltransferase